MRGGKFKKIKNANENVQATVTKIVIHGRLELSLLAQCRRNIGATD